MAQTSVEILVEKLQESGITFMKDELEMIKQAKEMHKSEIINAYDNVIINDLGEFLNGEQYYNETFK